MAAFIVGVCLVGVVVVSLFLRLISKSRTNYDGKHIVITGGSEGIGRSLALEFSKSSAHVTVIARTEQKLADAVLEMKSLAKPHQKIDYACADVTNEDQINAAIDLVIKRTGPIDLLVVCAGASYPGYFLDQDISLFQKSMQLNYFGALIPIKKVSPHMARRKSGHIVIVASALSVIGFLGYSSYAPAKWALRGLADCLRNELLGFNVKVSIAYPPDTNTPGFERENETKPKETLEISPPSVYEPEVVSRSLFEGIRAGDFHISSPDAVQNLLVSSMSGISPRKYNLIEWLICPLILIMEYIYLVYMDYIARKYGKNATIETESSFQDEDKKYN